MPKRATTSSRRPPSTRPFSIPASSWKSTASASPICRCRPNGLIDLDMLREAITDKTILVTHHVRQQRNRRAAADRGDRQDRQGRACCSTPTASQAVGKVPVDVIKDNIDLMSITAHKMYGPKGVGALYVRRRNPRVQLTAQMDGGGHERGMRSGTLNVPGIVGLGEACAICQARNGRRNRSAWRYLRDKLKDKLEAELDEIYINGSMEHRLPHNLNISFAYVEGESLLMGINDIAVSSGSACTSATLEPSYVLKAWALGDDWRTRPSASASAGSTRKKKSITWRTR